MIKLKIKYISFLFLFFFVACSYKPIFTEKNYSFVIKELTFIGNNEINRIINNKLKLIKKGDELNKKKIYHNNKYNKRKSNNLQRLKGRPIKI